MDAPVPQVGVIGCGYWGKNLVRVAHELGALGALCDADPALVQEFAARYPAARATTEPGRLFDDPRLAAIVIAAPAGLHYALAKEALAAGKDVFVEKPLTLSVGDGEALVAEADRVGRLVFVGHILEYHPAVEALRRLINAGALGTLRYISCHRLNLGRLRTNENVLWSFAPHDVALTVSLLGEMPDVVSAHGRSFLSPGVEDTVIAGLRFPSGALVELFVSWLHPFKEQKLTIVGSDAAVVFDDIAARDKVTLYRHQIHWKGRMPTPVPATGESIPIPQAEPLKQEVSAFLHSVLHHTPPRTDGLYGLRALHVLEALTQSLRNDGRPISMNGIVESGTRAVGVTAEQRAVRFVQDGSQSC